MSVNGQGGGFDQWNQLLCEYKLVEISCGLTWCGMGFVRSARPRHAIHERIPFDPGIWKEVV